MDQFEARFSGIRRLLPPDGADRLRHAHVCVVGLGGVGSWAIEALARSGLGELTLIDLDDICISNTNRQLHAITSNFGKPKVEAMRQRVTDINPDCILHSVHSLFLKSNARQLLASRFDYVIDAIDSPSLKSHLVAVCCELGISVIVSGAAGGRLDPTAVEVADLALSSHDALLRQLRTTLRRRYGFPRGDALFGVDCVFLREIPVLPETAVGTCGNGTGSDLRLDCATGYGTAAFVTGTFGFVAASRVIQKLAAIAPSTRAGSTPLSASVPAQDI